MAAKISSDKLPKEITIASPGGNLALKQWEGTSTVPTLAVHGWLDNAASFDTLAPLLAPVTLTALDLPGHGLSDPKAPGAIYHFVDWIWDVLAVADGLGWKTFNLLGHSLGGNIALMLAAVAGERVNKVAVLDALGPSTDAAEKVVFQLRAYRTGVEESRTKRTPYYRSVEDVAKTRARYPGRPMEYASALAICRRGLVETKEGFTWRSDSRLTLPSPVRLTEAHVESLFRAISCPVLVVQANPGLNPPAELLARRKRYVPHAEIVEVNGGHHVHLDHPEVVASKVREFLS